MMRTEDLAIDGMSFSLTTLPAMQALRLQPLIAQCFAPVLKHAGKLSQIKDLASVDVSSVAEIVAEVASVLDGKRLEDITRALLAGGQVRIADRNDDILTAFDECFVGEPMRLWKLLLSALKLNYGNFLKPLRK